MKQWKLVLVALLSVLLVCTCMSALADETTSAKCVAGNPNCTCTEWKYYTRQKATCTAEGKKIKSCASCGWAFGEEETIAKLSHDYQGPITKEYSSCTKQGYTVWECTMCSAEKAGSRVTLPLVDHKWDVKSSVAATCLTKGSTTFECSVCHNTYVKDNGYLGDNVYGHNFGTLVVDNQSATCGTDGWTKVQCDYCDATSTNVVKATGNHTWGKWQDVVKATCTTAGSQIRYCTNKDCKENGAASQTQNVKALGHKYKTTTVAATCTAKGSETTICENGCGYYKFTEIAKLDHTTVDVVTHPAFCKETGLKDVKCVVCGNTVKKDVVIPATGHKGKWIVTKAATATADGEKQLICQNFDSKGNMCGEVLDKKTVKYSEMMYNNTITGFGPCTRDLIGGKTWNRVTPVDLSVDGTYTYDLVASNKYVVGTLVVTVANGTMTVNYELNATQIKVNEETLTIYANLDALKNGTGLTATVGTPIDVAANFGEDTKVIVAFAAKADYNAVGAGVSSFKADDAQLAALIANID